MKRPRYRIRLRFFIVAVVVAVSFSGLLSLGDEQIFLLKSRLKQTKVAACFFGDLQTQALKQINRPFDFVVEYLGLKYAGNTRYFVDREVLFKGAYEKHYLMFVEHVISSMRLKDLAVVLDVGAYHGTHALFMARFCKSVHAFEPMPASMDYLRQNVELNGFKNIQLHQVGLGAENVFLPMFDIKQDGSNVASFSSDIQKGSRKVGTMEIVRGDDFLNKIEVNKVHLAKIDVEGFEKQVLSGFALTLKRDRPVVLLEVTSGLDQNGFSSISEVASYLPVDYKLRVMSTNNFKDWPEASKILSSWPALQVFINLVAYPADLDQVIF